MRFKKLNFLFIFSYILLPIITFCEGAKVEVSDSSTTRIISLAPSITETLFALEQGNYIVGVTKFCKFPKEAKTKDNIGGFVDINFEAILRLKPNVIVSLPSHKDKLAALKKYPIKFIEVSHNNTGEIFNSIKQLGDAFSIQKQALKLEDKLRRELATIEQKNESKMSPKVMIVIGRDYSTGSLGNIYIAGPSGFHGDLLALAGGTNVYQNKKIAYPKISPEGLIRLNPEVIIELIPDLKSKKLNEKKLISDWKSLPMLKAVKKNQVYILGADYVSIPGPRFTKTVRAIAGKLQKKNTEKSE